MNSDGYADHGLVLVGRHASFTTNAIQLGSYVTCRALASTTLETMNRGISVNNSAFDTPEGVTLTVKQRLRYAGDLTKFGICNATPVIATDDGRLHVKIDADPMPESGRAPIFTVSSATAASLRGKIVVEKPARGCKGVVTERTCDDGSVTFVAEFQRTGFVVVFR